MEVIDVEWLLLPIISEAGKQEIKNKLPDFSMELAWLSGLHQDWLDHLAGPKSSLPISKICLLDAIKVASQANYALGQSYAHMAWFKTECPNAPQNSSAHHYGRFYADDAILRLYAAAEHVANFVVTFLSIPQKDFAKHRKEDKQTAMAVSVGQYLIKQKPTHPVTSIINNLKSNEWEFVWKYRNSWVHNKPPTLDSPGVDYKRVNRWRQIGNIYSLGIGTNYVPEYALDNLLNSTLQATWDFSKALTSLTDLYFQEIESLGIKRDIVKEIITLPDNYWNR